MSGWDSGTVDAGMFGIVAFFSCRFGPNPLSYRLISGGPRSLPFGYRFSPLESIIIAPSHRCLPFVLSLTFWFFVWLYF